MRKSALISIVLAPRWNDMPCRCCHFGHAEMSFHIMFYHADDRGEVDDE